MAAFTRTDEQPILARGLIANPNPVVVAEQTLLANLRQQSRCPGVVSDFIGKLQAWDVCAGLSGTAHGNLAL
jgi:hypothetical protein